MDIVEISSDQDVLPAPEPIEIDPAAEHRRAQQSGSIFAGGHAGRL